MSVTFDRVSFVYAPGTTIETTAVRDVTVHIADGEYLAIMGRTGSGKSTLGLLLAGLLQPSAGRVAVGGVDLASGRKAAEVRRRIGVVFQIPERQLFESTVERDVGFALRKSGLPQAEVANRVHEALAVVGLDPDDVATSSPLALSGGQQRRVAIAGVLVTRPSLLVLDEPTAGLDPAGRLGFLDLIDELNATGVTVVLISHDAEAVAEHAHRLVLMDDGRVMLDAPVDRAFEQVDLLAECGVGLPPVARVAHLLAGAGVGVPPGTCRYADLMGHLNSVARTR